MVEGRTPRRSTRALQGSPSWHRCSISRTPALMSSLSPGLASSPSRFRTAVVLWRPHPRTSGRRLVPGFAGQRHGDAPARPAEKAKVSITPTEFGDRSPRATLGPFDPKPKNDVIALPIGGLIAQANASGVSIELILPIEGGGEFCLHFGGGVAIGDADGPKWTGAGDADDQTTLGPMLDLVGRDVVDARIEGDGRLRLSSDGSRLITSDDRWEAHWPDRSAPYDERWVPREGPSIP